MRALTRNTKPYTCPQNGVCPWGLELEPEMLNPTHARRPGSIGEGARFLNLQLSNRLFGKTGGLDQLFEFLSVLKYKVSALLLHLLLPLCLSFLLPLPPLRRGHGLQFHASCACNQDIVTEL